jgi:NAD(P)-dependent dehydrogenase (short-subunit alcohol dehydrogenase family)
MADQITRFVLDDLRRRPADRGLLFVSPRRSLAPALIEGVQRLVVRVDVSQRKEIDTMVENTLDHFCRVDILLNNA